MFKNIETIKGIHPGFVLERELKKRGLGKGRFAISVDEFPQTLVSITKGKRKMNTSLALKIEKALGLEEGYLMILQVYHDIREEKQKQSNQRPDLTQLRPVLFWDTHIEHIDWQKNKKAVIQRVFERGNEAEQALITQFYGNDVITSVLNDLSFAL
jgi:plasmid maintenance system antidote protein VapI